MYLTSAQCDDLARVFAVLAEDCSDAEIRLQLGRALLRLLRSDYFGSFVWQTEQDCFRSGVWLNMDDANVNRYEQYFQFNDPITHRLRVRRCPTLVNQVIEQSELMRTEFYNDFLLKDGLHYGVHLHAFDSDTNIGDLRIWRGRTRENFDMDTLRLLALVQPAFTLALKRVRSRQAFMQSNDLDALLLHRALSPKEREIACRVRDGLTDRQIASEMNVAITTVRTHLSRIFKKLNMHHRGQLIRHLGGVDR